ncbi:MAG: 50S ribosomal protein L29 [Bacilli bacterium]|nr:50S ribosomal protein L29 [Bacilli bacterium]
MKVNEIRNLSNEEIETKVKETKKELLNLRVKNATGSLEKPSKIKELRKDVARMLTILKERKNEVSTGGNK